MAHAISRMTAGHAEERIERRREVAAQVRESLAEWLKDDALLPQALAGWPGSVTRSLSRRSYAAFNAAAVRPLSPAGRRPTRSSQRMPSCGIHGSSICESLALKFCRYRTIVLHHQRDPKIHRRFQPDARESFERHADDRDRAAVHRENVRPTMSGSDPNVCDHIAWLITATGCAPSVWLSSRAQHPAAEGRDAEHGEVLARYELHSGRQRVAPAFHTPVHSRRLDPSPPVSEGSGAARRNSVEGLVRKARGRDRARRSWLCDVRWNSSDALPTGNDVSINAFSAVNTTLFAPMPTASESTTAATKPGLLRNVRSAYRRSCVRASTNGNVRWSRYCSFNLIDAAEVASRCRARIRATTSAPRT